MLVDTEPMRRRYDLVDTIQQLDELWALVKKLRL